MTSESIKPGDQFTTAGCGTVTVVDHVDNGRDYGYGRGWMCDTPSNGQRRILLEHPTVTRLPTTQPTVCVGDVVRDPGLLREGMRVRHANHPIHSEPVDFTLGARYFDDGAPQSWSDRAWTTTTGVGELVTDDCVRAGLITLLSPATEGAAPTYGFHGVKPVCGYQVGPESHCFRTDHDASFHRAAKPESTAAPEPVKPDPYARHALAETWSRHDEDCTCAPCDWHRKQTGQPATPQRPRTGPPEPMRSGLANVAHGFTYELPYASNARK